MQPIEKQRSDDQWASFDRVRNLIYGTLHCRAHEGKPVDSAAGGRWRMRRLATWVAMIAFLFISAFYSHSLFFPLPPVARVPPLLPFLLSPSLSFLLLRLSPASIVWLVLDVVSLLSQSNFRPSSSSKPIPASVYLR